MAVSFILGRSGTGKTRYCIKSIIEALLQPDETPLVLLVPEQASYQAERAILSDGRINGYSRLNVLSFNRLGFLLLGRRMSMESLSRSGQQMAVAASLLQCKDKLRLLGTSALTAGFASELARTLTEIQRSCLEPDDIDNLAKKLALKAGNELSARKFADIAEIYNRYRMFLAGRFENPDTDLTDAKKAVQNAEFLRNARLWVDGFAGFTRQEFELLIELLKAASESRIALCLDPEQIDINNCSRESIDTTRLFYPTEYTYADLLEAIRKSRLELKPSLILREQHRFASSALRHLEKEYPAYRPKSFTGNSEAIELIEAPNRRIEAEYIAAEIAQLVRTGRYRYRDIAVIASDVNSYRHYLAAAFDDFNIPFFVDIPRSLSEYLPVRLVISALRAVTSGYDNSHVLSFLKTGLGPLSTEQISLLEDYCDEFGVKNADWKTKESWRFSPKEEARFDEAEINSLRINAVKPLAQMEEDLARPGGMITAEELAESVIKFLKGLSAAQQYIASGTADDNLRVFWGRFTEVLDEFVDVFAGISLPIREYTEIFCGAVESNTVAVIPPTLDQVLVGAIERSRHPDLKAAFLAGCNQGQFPSSLVNDSIVTDEERLTAESLGLSIGQTLETQLASRQYLAYIAVTRASEKLYISWPLADEKGSSLSRSEYVERMMAMLPDPHIKSATDQPLLFSRIFSTNHLTDLLCMALGRDPSDSSRNIAPSAANLYETLKARSDFQDSTGLIERAIQYKNIVQVKPSTVVRAIGADMQSSATELGAYAACPYRHFAEYLLRLQPRRQFRFEPVDLGKFYHLILDMLTKTLLSRGLDFATARTEEVTSLLNQTIEQVLTAECFFADFQKRSSHNAFILDEAATTLERCVAASCTTARAGRMHTVASELVFGIGKGSIPALVMPLKNGVNLRLRGKIDRLDIAQDGDKTLAFVFDYKTKDKSVPWLDIYHGLDLQLPLYLLALKNRSIGGYDHLMPAGAFYFPVHGELSEESSNDDETEHKTYFKSRGIFCGKYHRLLDADAPNSKWSLYYNFYKTKEGEPYGNETISGAFRDDAYERLLAFVQAKATSIAQAIIDGIVQVRPYRKNGRSPCSYCQYRPLCRFDWQVNDYNFLKPASRQDIIGDGDTDE